MALRKILTEGDPALNKISRPVTNFDERLHTLIDDLRETLESARGYGLAAPQVGILRRVALVTNSEDVLVELINPVIIEQEGEQHGYEGCLSVPGMYGDVTRPMRVKVRAQDRNGNVFEVEDTEMTARCFCHEIEHLDGHLFTERVEGELYSDEELEALMEEESKRK